MTFRSLMISCSVVALLVGAVAPHAMAMQTDEDPQSPSVKRVRTQASQEDERLEAQARESIQRAINLANENILRLAPAAEKRALEPTLERMGYSVPAMKAAMDLSLKKTPHNQLTLEILKTVEQRRGPLSIEEAQLGLRAVEALKKAFPYSSTLTREQIQDELQRYNDLLDDLDPVRRAQKALHQTLNDASVDEGVRLQAALQLPQEDSERENFLNTLFIEKNPQIWLQVLRGVPLDQEENTLLFIMRNIEEATPLIEAVKFLDPDDPRKDSVLEAIINRPRDLSIWSLNNSKVLLREAIDAALLILDPIRQRENFQNIFAKSYNLPYLMNEMDRIPEDIRIPFLHSKISVPLKAGLAFALKLPPADPLRQSFLGKFVSDTTMDPSSRIKAAQALGPENPLALEALQGIVEGRGTYFEKQNNEYPFDRISAAQNLPKDMQEAAFEGLAFGNNALKIIPFRMRALQELPQGPERTALMRRLLNDNTLPMRERLSMRDALLSTGEEELIREFWSSVLRDETANKTDRIRAASDLSHLFPEDRE